GRSLYVAVVQGTFSYWKASNYTKPQRPWTKVCGTPEPAPQFSSAGGSGPVGMDAEFVFARPWLPRLCAKLPEHRSRLQMYTGAGAWAHPNALTPVTAPSPDHLYEYAVVGEGRRVSFRLRDWYLRDNYGSLSITLRTASAADCAGSKYRAFGAESEAQCVSEL
ncbi:MAG TPA: hypothetical protein VKV16_05475, partial [Solirubrobacteraceae bacterium]|nr:hypothetical protein [Solirubrobacteraceae bacterium]